MYCKAKRGNDIVKQNSITKEFFFKFGLYGGISFALVLTILHYVSEKRFSFVWLSGGVAFFLGSVLLGKFLQRVSTNEVKQIALINENDANQKQVRLNFQTDWKLFECTYSNGYKDYYFQNSLKKRLEHLEK